VEHKSAIRAAVDEALEARAQGRPRTILFGLSGRLQDYEYPGREIDEAKAGIPGK
jgi:predicted alternative tryptophan synthase beta-subunit